MTAVNWLDEKLQDTMYIQYGYVNGVRKVVIPLEDYMGLKKEAIELEKQQIIDAINEVSRNNVMYANKIVSSLSPIEGELFTHNEKLSEQYYNEKFKKND